MQENAWSTLAEIFEKRDQKKMHKTYDTRTVRGEQAVMLAHRYRICKQ